MKFGLDHDLIENFNAVFSHYPQIEKVLIYGSRAMGNYRRGSDIDLVLKGKNLTSELRAKIHSDLDHLNTPYFIDLSIWHKLQSKNFKLHMEREGKVFYSSPAG